MAKRHKGQGTVVRDAGRAAPAERAREGLGRFEMASSLAARTRPFVVAAERLWHGWRIVRQLERAGAAAAQVRRATATAMRASVSESHARENLSHVVSLARAVESGNPRAPRVNRANVETLSGHARAHAGSAASREGARDERREDARRTEHRRHRGERRDARRNPGAEMHDAVRRAIDAQWALVGASRSALGLTRAVHGALERSWHVALKPDPRRAAREGAAIGNERERASSERGRDDAPIHVERGRAANHEGMHQALVRFGNTVGLLAKGLGAGSAASDRARGSSTASKRGREGAAQPLAAAVRIPAVPAFIPVPALAGGPRGRASNPAPAAPIVINSSPTLVVNRADSALDLEQRLLEVLRRHRNALYEQWEREREKRLRTEF